jgi:hypothetical protein
LLAVGERGADGGEGACAALYEQWGWLRQKLGELNGAWGARMMSLVTRPVRWGFTSEVTELIGVIQSLNIQRCFDRLIIQTFKFLLYLLRAPI